MEYSIRKLTSAAVMFSAVLLTGCSLTKPAASYQPTVVASVDLLSPEASAALDGAMIDQKLTLVQSPWGEQVELTIVSRYFAASGRSCMQALVQIGLYPSPVVICQYPGQGWGASRDLRGQQQLSN